MEIFVNGPKKRWRRLWTRSGRK